MTVMSHTLTHVKHEACDPYHARILQQDEPRPVDDKKHRAIGGVVSFHSMPSGRPLPQPWSLVLLSVEANVKGVQFDRILSIYFEQFEVSRSM